VTDQLSDFAIWTGAIVGLIKIVDGLLLETHKKWLTEIFETAWV